ncbi:nitrite reductase small subunit NirD [Jeotgalibacillus proteolyticus]|uniref:Nitrite reductase (NAD(P)H) small subunit n=1 Tax=Jeotgalibacillus proteolyticus TaxID=2082395 RepID=A0A2S5GDG5_9BACL|nr:nitrite reductase small subunit NirD [Jeotgalibacillus proteolyticus]PPA70998.1 nitrite reductase (NAD(P)H) small subunit [Jeotgalibacillus proteolyticus]
MEKMLNKVFVATITELPENLGRTVYVGEGKLELAIFKLSNGKIRVIENRCPHKGGVLAEGMVSGEHVFCPMHDWKINMSDGNVQAPDIGCVKTFQTEVQNNQVYVLLPEN